VTSLPQCDRDQPNGPFLCADVRLELCFLQFDEDYCGVPLPGKYRMDVCCCSIGVSWGAECKACPEPDSPEFASLCPRGLGFASQDFLSGRPFYKGLAGEGEREGVGPGGLGRASMSPGLEGGMSVWRMGMESCQEARAQAGPSLWVPHFGTSGYFV
jgi:hypothetical protein